MTQRKKSRYLLTLITSTAFLSPCALVSAAPKDKPSPAPIKTDEGGTVSVIGEWNYSNPNILSYFPEPVVALMDVSTFLRENSSEWVPRSGQIVGMLTSPLTTAPVHYRIQVPVLPTGQSIDLDNDGQQDQGIQVYLLTMASNMVGDSYLEQLEQEGFQSVLTDPKTGKVREGDLLLFSPDDAQGFPLGAGEDGLFFTEDDPIGTLPSGYTVATLTADGKVRFDRSREARLDLREPVAQSSADFSEQGILESFQSLMDFLEVRYAYTELRELDWKALRKKFQPAVEKADRDKSMDAYYLALHDLAQTIHDSHVQVDAGDPSIRLSPVKRVLAAHGATLGAAVKELSDGRFVVTYLDPEGPAAKAGWQFGTEILTVDGVPMGKRVDTLPFLESKSTPEGTRLARLQYALGFPKGATTTVEFRQPGEEQASQATLTAGHEYLTAPPTTAIREEISFKKLDGNYGYIQWDAFHDPLYELAVWQKFLETFHDAPGIIIDLRDNRGGNVGLLHTMASFLFSADQPAPLHWLDSYVYDGAKNGFVRSLSSDNVVSAPLPELAYSGPVAVLVNEGSASAAEYFPQFLQRQGRAVVIGEHGSDGAGGLVEQVRLPGTIVFHYTKQRTVFAGTDEYNLEGKGVTLDHRVPITLDNERAKLDGGDPVLEAGLTALATEANRRDKEKLVGSRWQLAFRMNAVGKKLPVETPERYSVTFKKDGTLAITADLNRVQGTYTLENGGTLAIKLGPSTLAANPPGSLGDDFLKWLAAANSLQFDNDELFLMVNPEAGILALNFEPAK